MDTSYMVAVGTTLKNVYHRYYFQHQNYKRDTGFLGEAAPLQGMENFFGPEVLCIIVISSPKKEIDPATAAQLDRIKTGYSKWRKYRVYIYIDFGIVKKVKEKYPQTDFEGDMDATATLIQSICNDMKDYGFHYGGKLNDQPKPEDFEEIIKAFYDGQ
jgi:hypothetical protein